MNKIEQFTGDMVVIKENEYTNPTGSIECVLCQPIDGKREPQTVQSKEYGDPPKVYWILSNFSKHIDKHDKKPKLNALNELNLLPNECCSHKNDDESLEYTEEMVDVIKNDEDILIETVVEINETNDSTIHLQIEPLNQSPTVEDVQSLIYIQISEQLNNMLEVSLKHNIKEIDMVFKIDNKEFIFQFAEIEPDGNCLIAALVHQLLKLKIGDRPHLKATAKLRKDVVDHIKRHRSDYEHELKGMVYEQNEGKQVADIYTECIKYLEKDLPKDGFWAGSETISAVTRMKSVNILIVNANGKCYFPFGFQMKFRKTVILTFGVFNYQIDNEDCDNTQRNHYSSVVRMDQADIYVVSQSLAEIEHKKIIQEQIDSVDLLNNTNAME